MCRRLVALVAVSAGLVGVVPASGSVGVVQSPPMGELRVTTSPAVPSTIRVDGIDRGQWGLNWLDIEAGEHEVCFSGLPGFAAPPCEQVVVPEGGTATVSGVFEPLVALQVTTVPAVPATITVRDVTADGPVVPMNVWGVQTFVADGRTFEVCFGAAAGYVAPPCEQVAINGSPVVVSGAYTTDPAALGPVGFGELRVTTSPAVPSTITIDGQTRNDWGLDWLQLTPGAYEVCFGDVVGFATPACEQAVVTAGTTTTVEGQFETLGLLAVSTDPPVESTISVNGVPRDDWGVWLPIAPGDHQVCFSPATTGQHPVEQCQTATVTAAQITPVTATFGPATSSTTRVSIATDGTQANSWNETSAVSDDGRYVAFMSYASNLVPGDTNGIPDVFVRDRWTGRTARVSVAFDGTQANRQFGYEKSDSPTISGDGRYIAFRSNALLLFPGDPTPSGCLCVHDLWTGTTTKVAGGGNDPQISHDGRYVTFSTGAALVPEDTNGRSDVFVYDRSTGATSLVSVAPDGTQFDLDSSGPQISGDGRYVAFTANICFSGCGGPLPPWYPLAGDTITIPTGTSEVFVHDRSTGTTTLVSKTAEGTRAHGGSAAAGISADGRYILFSSAAGNLVDDDLGAGGVLVRDQVTGTISRVTIHTNQFGGPTISADGRYVAFATYVSDLVPGDTNGDTDVFVHDRSTGTTTRVSVASDGTQANDQSLWPAISADGRFVTFMPYASNLVPDDTNGTSDVFVHERSTT